jgi:hypothetical protein
MCKRCANVMIFRLSLTALPSHFRCTIRYQVLEDSANLPAPDILTAEIIDDLKSALEQFDGLVSDLGLEE